MNEAPPLGVYVHWPYCARICPYCDFNIYKNRDVDAARWTKALARDLAFWAMRTKDRKLTSLYFGGGTPSLAPVSVIEGVIDACETLWGFEPDAEVTLEANPTDAEQSRFEAFAAAGINRLSLGVQSLRDDALVFLGRNHDAEAARRALKAAISAFPRVSFDLIYARPGQCAGEWREELIEALSFAAGHLSLYQLTIEPGTAFAKAVAAKRWAPASDDLCADMYDISQDLTAAAGLRAYEVSNHAKAGDEARHNLLYWRYQDYIGVGPGAHGRLTSNGERLASETHASPESYLTSVESEGSGVSAGEPLDADAELAERLTMGLRLSEGIDLYADDHFYADEGRADRLAQLVADGMLSHHCGRLRASEKGRRVLDAVLLTLLG